MQKYNPAWEFIKKHAFFLLGGACIIIVGIIYIVSRGADSDVVRDGDIIFLANAEEAGFDEENSPEPSYIIIHIAGAVKNPGVFELPYGSRVNHALELAGGASDYADLNRVNLAAFLHDAMKVIIPAEGEEVESVFIFSNGEAQDETTAGGIRSDGLININTATSDELQTLSGIGPVLSQNIIDFRAAHGGFSSVEELIHVSRIGAATLDRLRPFVTVE